MIENSYFHGWSHGAYDNGATPDSYRIILGTSWANPANPNSAINGCVFDGSDTDTVSGGATYNWPVISNSVFRNLTNAANGVGWQVNGNDISYINPSYDPTLHMNAIEVWLGTGSPNTQYIFDNKVHDLQLGTYPLDIGPGFGQPSGAVTAYVFNNDLWNVADVPITFDSQGTPTSARYYVFNNTIVVSLIPPYNGMIGCIRVENRGDGNLGYADVENNDCVTETGSIFTYDAGMSINSLAQNHNVIMTNEAAPSSTATSGAGANLTSICTLNSQMASLCRTLTGSVRPATGDWNAGSD